ncbi:uncharacterized protein Bfra_005701 [Botrytis fragariae]|uniref:Uncharacterized protein n=1 Tax=Botrytis fragariae TaxID=1964551 RepID=A0A8H6EHF8_9HELO|nr:uncharacterized protein Bfra_005701 [Botrytis fragariae]KAF5872343.1 hypothetical protein Bfra_005701 [Botrytis fragariae]
MEKDFEAQFILRFTKFKRDTTQEDDIIHLAPLDKEEVNYMRPLALLIQHCLGNGLLTPSIAAVLNHTEATLAKGTTRYYVLVYNERVKAMLILRGAPKIASEPLTDHNLLFLNSICNARKAVRHARLQGTWEAVKAIGIATASLVIPEIVLKDLSTNSKMLLPKGTMKNIPISDTVPPWLHKNHLHTCLLANEQNPVHVAEGESYMVGPTFVLDGDELKQIEVSTTELYRHHTVEYRVLEDVYEA